MKRIRKTKKDLNLIPMINIIFLLLIFFMLTGVIQEKSLFDIQRPSSENSQIENNENSNRIVISVTNENKIYIKNQQIKLNELSSRLENLNNSVKVIIEVDKNLTVKNFTKILSIIKKMEIKKVFVRSLKIKDDRKL